MIPLTDMVNDQQEVERTEDRLFKEKKRIGYV